MGGRFEGNTLSMPNRAFQVLAWSMAVIAIVVLPLLDWGTLASLSTESWIGLTSLVVLGLLSEHLALGVHVGKAVSTSSITFLLIFGSVLLFGPEATALFTAISWFVSQFVLRRKALTKAVFNVAQIVASTIVRA